jgi:hypothetical protein
MDSMTPEDLAKLFHDTYERLAPNYGYETRKESAVPWEDVPVRNKELMVNVAEEVLAAISPRPGEMHSVDQAFYNLTVAQRNQAWQQADALSAELAEVKDKCQKDARTIRALLEDLDGANESIENLLVQAECDCVYVMISSKSCRKCGKRATIPGWQADSLFVELTQLKYKLKNLIEDYRNDDGALRTGTAADRIETEMQAAEKIAREHGERLRDE